MVSIRIGTRASALALTQAEYTRARLLAADPNLDVSIVKITTTGDVRLDPTLADIGGKGLFTKEIEEALLRKDIDLAVHSMKDMQTWLPAGLAIAAVPVREDPRDAFVSVRYKSFADLPVGAVVGTSSPRRAAILKHRRADLKIVPLRGNVTTRLEKVKNGEMDATILAVAGLKRLKLEGAITEALSISEFLPSAAQGALCLQCRENDTELLELVHTLNHLPTEIAVTAERAMVARLDGSCRTPIGAHAFIEDDMLNVLGQVLSPDGAVVHSVHLEGSIRDAAALGDEAGKALLEKAGPGFICG